MVLCVSMVMVACGKKDTSTTGGTTGGDEEQTHAHVWGAWQTTDEATCTGVGQKRRVCNTNGNHIEYEDIPVLGHSYGDWAEITPATNTTKGTKRRTCTRDSSHVDNDDIPLIPFANRTHATAVALTVGIENQIVTDGDGRWYDFYVGGGVSGKNLIQLEISSPNYNAGYKYILDVYSRTNDTDIIDTFTVYGSYSAGVSKKNVMVAGAYYYRICVRAETQYSNPFITVPLTVSVPTALDLGTTAAIATSTTAKPTYYTVYVAKKQAVEAIYTLQSGSRAIITMTNADDSYFTNSNQYKEYFTLNAGLNFIKLTPDGGATTTGTLKLTGMENAVEYFSNITTSGAIEKAVTTDGTVDKWLGFYLGETSAIRITAETTSGTSVTFRYGNSLAVQLYSADLVQINTQSMSGGDRMFAVLKSGNYFIKYPAGSSSWAGKFIIKKYNFEDNLSPNYMASESYSIGDMLSLNNGTDWMYIGGNSQNDMIEGKVYKFTVPSVTNVSITPNAGAVAGYPTFDTDLLAAFVWGGNAVAHTTDRTASVYATLPAGTCYLWIAPNGGSGYDFTRNSTFQIANMSSTLNSATVITLGASVSTHSSTASKWYKFTLAETTNIFLDTGISAQSNAAWSLFNGTDLTNAIVRGASLREHLTLNAGTYYIFISADGYLSVTKYTYICVDTTATAAVGGDPAVVYVHGTGRAYFTVTEPNKIISVSVTYFTIYGSYATEYSIRQLFAGSQPAVTIKVISSPISSTTSGDFTTYDTLPIGEYFVEIWSASSLRKYTVTITYQS